MQQPCFLIFCFGFAVNTAIGALFTVCEFENLRKFLLNGGNATRIAAFDNVAYFVGQFQMNALCKHTFTDDADGDAGIEIPDYVKIDVNEIKNLDDIFFAHFNTVCIHDHGDRTAEIAEFEHVVDTASHNAL